MEIDHRVHQLRCELRGHEDDVSFAWFLCFGPAPWILLLLRFSRSMGRYSDCWTLESAKFDGLLTQFYRDDQVRGICILGGDMIATSSRDRTVRVWSLSPSDRRKYESTRILLGHTSFVGPLAWIPPNGQHPEGGIVSGGMDTLVLVWDLRTGEKVQTLRGHQSQVTGILLDDSGSIVSSSMDW